MDNNKFNGFKPSNGLSIIIIALILVLFIVDHSAIALIASTIFGAFIIYNHRSLQIKKQELEKYIEKFSTAIDIDSKNILLRVPFPLIIINEKGQILWHNASLSTIFESSEILGKNVSSLIKDVDVKKIINSKKISYKNLLINHKYYDMHLSNIEPKGNKKGNITLLYFIDVTNEYYLRKELQDSKDAVMLIEVDNLDEVLKVTDADKRPLLEAEIERKINSYNEGLNGVLKKYFTGKYILFLRNKYINKEIEKKFDILDTIREINLTNKLSVTLSIGVGVSGDTPLENYNLAVSAIELALGRGGDQAVVKTTERLLFFGGKTKEIEKRTKVRARVLAHALLDVIKNSSNIFIMGHVNPDIDCFGAAIGLNSVIRSLGKDAYIVLDEVNNSIESIYDQYVSVDGNESVIIKSSQCFSMADENSLLIVVDTNSRSYLLNGNVLDIIKKVVIIDHHRRSKSGIEEPLLHYIETYASSTSELITEMIQYMKESHKLSIIEAEALLAGITVDTKNFCFKTGVRTFEAAAFLRSQGADTIEVKKLFANDLERVIARSEIIKSAKVENSVAIAICPTNIEDNVLAAQAADELLNITGIQASFVLVKIGCDVVISGRSLGEINVQLILEELGGGGHLTMAGARVEKGDLSQVTIQLKEAVDKYLREGED